ncbi:hypothetical protein [Paenibacillus taichungensis]
MEKWQIAGIISAIILGALNFIRLIIKDIIEVRQKKKAKTSKPRRIPRTK